MEFVCSETSSTVQEEIRKVELPKNPSGNILRKDLIKLVTSI